MKLPILYIVIPCYNEQSVLPITAPMFKEQLSSLIAKNKISVDSKILFVNDGSKDNTWNLICELAQKDSCFIGISQSRNRGHQNAVLAGLMEAKNKCDITISIDCDGQDDINAMEEMVDAYLDGSDVVYGVRKKRETDTFFKRFTAQSFYKCLKVMGVEIVYNHADYRLVSKPVLDAFSKFEEVNLFLRGMFPLVGFKSTVVYYDRNERIAGESHYPLSKMLALAIDGITSLSVGPIRIITALGVLLSVLSGIGLIYILFRSIFDFAISNNLLLISVIGIACGIQLLCLGIIGEYIGKMYLEIKRRPRYIISERTYGVGKGDN